MAALSADLFSKGYAVCPGFVPDEVCAALRLGAARLYAEAKHRPAGVGRDQNAVRDATIRRTEIAWIERQSPVEALFLDWCESLRHALNRETYLGLFEFEAHYARYPVGGFYARHRDSFVGARNRTVSLVLYLNESWRPEWGGALELFADDTGPVIERIDPSPGTAVFMMAETQWHAVEATKEPRLAIAGWWRVNQSAENRVDPPR